MKKLRVILNIGNGTSHQLDIKNGIDCRYFAVNSDDKEIKVYKLDFSTMTIKEIKTVILKEDTDEEPTGFILSEN